MRSAYDEAVRMLARRSYSRRDLAERLTARGLGEDGVMQAVERLERDGALDDLRYARSYVVARGASHGRDRVLAELSQRGVAPDVALRAWREERSEGSLDEAGSLSRAVRRRLGPPPGRADRGRLARVYNALLSEGFEPAPVASALVPYGFEGNEE